MAVLRYLKGEGVAVALVFVLMIGQAFCDLSLPRYTSDLVDVGLQQSGVEHASPQAMTVPTFEDVASLLDPTDEAALRSAYLPQDDGTYRLRDVSADERADLDAAMEFPLVAVYAARDSSSEGASIAGILERAASGELSKQQAVGLVEEMKAQMPLSDGILSQRAIRCAGSELAAAGVDLDELRFSYLLRTGMSMLGFVAASGVIAMLISLIASRVGARIGRRLRSQLFGHVVRFSDAEVQSFSVASLITRGTNDIQQIQVMTVMALRMALYAPILAIGGIVMVARTNASLSWIIVLAIATVLVIVAALMAAAMPKFKRMQKLVDGVNLVSRELITGLQVVRAFGQQAREQRRFEDASERLMRTQLFTSRVMSLMMPLMMLVMNAVSVLIVWTGSSAVDSGTMQPGDLIALISYSMVIIMGFLMLGMLGVVIPRADVSAKRIDEVLSAPCSIQDPTVASKHAFPSTEGAEIAFDGVTFRYADSQECVLDDVSFTAEAGKTTAIIGSTGSGKSTVIKLVERFYDVSEGAVRVDGIDVREVAQADLRRQLGYVPQKAFLFSGTIASNVLVSADGLDEGSLSPEDEQRLDRALRCAQASQFVEDREEGANASVSQGGTNVSGGQRQRLAIARALASDARALLFDDSFSALDYRTDAALRRALAEEMRGKTVLMVAQRVATVMGVDKIVVLDEGRVVGQGTHDELLKTCDQYREIALSQLSAEELEGGDAV